MLVVYLPDEGRDAFPTLEAKWGQLNDESLIALANQIPLKGGNVMNAVFDATALRGLGQLGRCGGGSLSAPVSLSGSRQPWTRTVMASPICPDLQPVATSGFFQGRRPRRSLGGFTG